MFLKDLGSQMATLVLHIGYPKTGTSSLQVALTGNRARLRNLGIDYLDYGAGFARWGRSRFDPAKANHLDLAYTLLLDNAVGDREEIWSHVRTWVLENEHRFAVISGELFCELAEHQVIRLRRYLHGVDVKVLVWLRPQAEAILRRYLHAVKSGFAVASFPDFFRQEMRSGRYDYDRVLARWEVFGKGMVEARVYDRAAFAGGDIFSDFMHALDIDPDDVEIERPGDLNPTLGVRGYGLMRELTTGPGGYRRPDQQALLARGKEQPLSIRLLIQAMADQPIPDRCANLLTRRQIAKCRRTFDDGNERVARRYLRSPRSELFSDEGRPRHALDRVPRVSRKELLQVISRLMTTLDEYDAR